MMWGKKRSLALDDVFAEFGAEPWPVTPKTLCFKGGSSTTVVEAQKPTEEDRALTAKQVELAEAQLQAINQQTALQKELFAGTKELSDIQTDILKKLVAQTEAPLTESELKRQELSDELVNRQLEAIRRNGAASPEELTLIGEATNQALGAGEADIDRFSEEGLRQLREELAPALGLSASDAPILDRGLQLAKEATRQKSVLSGNLRSAEAQAKLNFPLAKEQLLSGINLSQQQLVQAANQFQADLAQQALLNRLGVADALQSKYGLALQGGLGLATGIPGVSALNSAVNAAAARRGSTQSSRSSQGIGLGEIGSVLGGIGGLASGAMAVFSSRDAKEIIGSMKPEEFADLLASLPVEFWRYKGDDALHAGPMAEDFQRTFKLGDGRTINYADALGVLFAAVKGLARRTAALEPIANGAT